ncbi:hypothetical protein D5E69_23270 (plasmid) [Rossellomorea marisflavi]|uniref:hypothetical protein n=1 Tax=Rossellomorea marisflavi TaxID=189381 RepID=UPI001318DBCC|nr:hypothetical protein [Rossellomorea marisflavi]QHA38754.1 hypothetical protein D5E69_23270 [Rossellomorea marisflavi]
MGIFIILAAGLGLWVFYRVMIKEPIFPWMEKKNNGPTPYKAKSGKKKGLEYEEEEEPEPFQELFSDIREISNHMIRFNNNKFVMVFEVDPCNYFLLSQDEQEQIDISFETWLSQISYNVQFYLQSRYVDLSEPIENMKKSMEEDEGLNEHAYEYGKSLVNNLLDWQRSTPRYETKMFLTTSMIINEKDIRAEDAEELEEKLVDKAFAELYRRFGTAKNALRKADMDVQLLTSDGIAQTLYYAFNRRKAVTNKFKDLGLKEMLALYCTADQSQNRIEAVKERIDNEQKDKEKVVQEESQAS